MQTVRVLILLIALAMPAVSGAADFVSTPHPMSFRGLEWGVSLADVPDLMPVQEKGYKDTYFKKNEPMKLDKADLQSVAYYFRKDKLYRVGVAFKGRVNQFLLKDMLIQAYGPGRGIGFRYGWMWPDFSIELNYDNEHDTGSLYYTFEGGLK
ncbi:hypothetical protein [Pseudodesulfovibrio portus]|uniref:Uncharacterized protein n=1 Tax=Pseudodesulfovibrio portus TaxID=231439 RepID=A0ABM8ARE6_9BACT|nr:hypothetical protein [Pseudodesulfovibrio portus]BDQ33985.1 hypothetical protein JCM14722_15270 [Pseudodesulfovibrio portus]